ncbi:MAG: glycogen debranching protein [Bacillota bacterium]|nr:MAG: glycogen debranching protein [Bacillota bacterium]
MYLGRHELGLEEATVGREWLLTNGMGGFASSTVGGLNTRRYHGWLVAQVLRYGGRFVVLSKLEEEVRLEGETYPLTTHRFAGGDQPEREPILTPRGYRHLQGFALEPLPVFTYYLKGFFIERAMSMPRGENRIVVLYHFSGPRETRLSLRLRPLVTFRFYHHLARANDWPFRTESGPGWVTVRSHDASPVLVLRHDPGFWSPGGFWLKGVDYLEERRRGLDHVEDLYSPGFLEFSGLAAGDRVAFTAALSDDDEHAGSLRSADFRVGIALAWHDNEERRLRDIVAGARRAVERSARAAGRPVKLSGPAGLPAERRDASSAGLADPLAPEASAFFARLVRATDAFVAVRGGGRSDAGRRTTIIAGYPWFEDWGRDTLIALPGLLLVTGRYEEAFRVLADYAAFARNGLIPNRFPDQAAEPDYNTADASLWLFAATQAYLAHTGELARVKTHLAGPMRDIARSYLRGTSYGIKAGSDGLVRVGEPGVAVTWMDAKLGDWVVTPRDGYPVEIQALWYNALRFLAELDGTGSGPGDAGESSGGRTWLDLAALARRSFNARFWNEEDGYLYDVVHDPDTGRAPDASVRPNQLLAVALPYPVLAESRWRQVVEVCVKELYTTYGLRTLARSDPAYRGLYRGGPAERDGAYHQGTVWPWLMGPLVTALRRAHGRSEESRLMAARMLRPFERHLREAGIGYISEVFDGDFPHLPGGCVAQAWSVSEVLRAYVEEVLDVRPVPADDGHAAWAHEETRVRDTRGQKEEVH